MRVGSLVILVLGVVAPLSTNACGGSDGSPDPGLGRGSQDSGDVEGLDAGTDLDEAGNPKTIPTSASRPAASRI